METPPSEGRLKAEIISMGRVQVPRELLSGYRLSRSSAGPGAGSTSLAIEWVGVDGREHSVKLSVAREGDDDVPLVLIQTPDGGLELHRADGSLVVGDVRLLPIVMHAPGQAFINLDGECVHQCAFCTTHMVDLDKKKLLEPQRWVHLVVDAYRKAPFDAMAITSVAAQDHESMIAAYEEIIVGVRREVPELKVGVEPYVNGAEDIARLKAAGADEIKINIQSPVPEILERICPGWSLEDSYTLLEEAVRIFGRGRVTTNIIVGLGETDDDVHQALDRLAAMGVIPSVRAIRLNALNRPNLERALGHSPEGVDPERHLRLAIMLHEALDRHGLDAGGLETMCHKCGCCDLEPGQDV